MRGIGRGVAAAVAIVAALSVGGSAAASPAAKSVAPANINPDKHPVTDPAQITRRPSVSPTSFLAVQQARAWAAEDPYSRFVCVTADGALATMGVVDRVDPSRPLTADERVQLCRALWTSPPAATRPKAFP